MSTHGAAGEIGAGERLDDESKRWVAGLTAPRTDPAGADALARLHAMLLRVARSEAARRAGTHGITGPELDDLAHQAADDATLSVLRRVTEFRGESRFTTWAYTFAVYEVSSKIGRHVWRRDRVRFDAESWELLPDRFGAGPDDEMEAKELGVAVRVAVDTELTPYQRRVFVAIVLEGIPVDALAIELETTRKALYKTMFDARRRLRTYLVTHGYLEPRLGRGR
ncbi:MAG: sigma-70 family RNA polymerase sigma factor [Sporichthyaceae bacterium]